MKPDGGPAFPFVLHENGAGDPGMSLRDYFAAHALIALIGRLGPLIKQEYDGPRPLPIDGPTVSENSGEHLRWALATVAYKYADAMLEARKS